MAKIKKEIIVYTNAYNMDVYTNKRELIPTMIGENDLMSFEDWLSEERGMGEVLEVLENAMKKNESAAFVFSALMVQYEEYVDSLIDHLLDIGGRYQSSSIVVEVEI